MFIETWKKEIYQKEPRMDLTFLYESKDVIGLKETMRREEAENRARGEEKMMPLPIMREEDLIRIVKKQKNGKATGVDGVKAETMKALIKNKKIRKGLLCAFNKCLKEKVNANWLESNTTMIPKTRKPGKKEHRPIAVTCWSSKIICTFIREKIEIHLEIWG